MLRRCVILLHLITFSRLASTVDVTDPESSGRLGRSRRRASEPLLSADKCVFILATEFSGSTALMDALNQIPHFLIRGENWAAHMNLYHAYQRLSSIGKAPGQEYFDWSEYKYASFHTVKSLYETRAPRKKLPFFNEFQVDRVVVATRAYYNVLFGTYGSDVVTGFKEIRYVCGVRFGSRGCAEQFYAFMFFLQKLCMRVKVLLLTRAEWIDHANPALFEHVPDGRRQQVQDDLKRTHEMYNEYAEAFPQHVYRVLTEDMFDMQKNATLARSILNFLEEDPSLPIRFTRMPG